MADIIPFPKKNVRASEPSPPEDLQQAQQSIFALRQSHVDAMTLEVSRYIFSRIASAGLLDHGARPDKYSAFLVEAIRAFLCAKNGIDHAFHASINNIFKVADNGEIVLNDEIAEKEPGSNSEPSPA